MIRSSPGLTVGLLCAISLILWFRPLLSTLALAINRDGYTHILLIVPITAALIFHEWRWRPVETQASTGGVGLLLFALVLAGLAKWGRLGVASDARLSISMAGLVTWWIGTFLFCFGLKGLRSFLFPLLFLFWMVPIPASVMSRVVVFLQQGSTVASQILFELARVPVSRQGVVLVIPGIEIEVATECSSIRSSVILMVTTMVLAQLFLRSPSRKLLLIVAAVPLSIAKNGLRIFTIAMLGTRVDPAFLTGRLHRNGGIVFFLIALVGIFLLLWILRRGEAEGP
jgi:exosortase